MKNYASVLSAEDVLDRWSKVETKVKALAADRALALVEKVKAKASQDDLSKKQIDNLVNFFRSLTGEQQMALYNGILGCGNNSNLVPFHKQVSGEIIGIINKAQAVSKK